MGTPKHITETVGGNYSTVRPSSGDRFRIRNLKTERTFCRTLANATTTEAANLRVAPHKHKAFRDPVSNAHKNERKACAIEGCRGKTVAEDAYSVGTVWELFHHRDDAEEVLSDDMMMTSSLNFILVLLIRRTRSILESSVVEFFLLVYVSSMTIIEIII